MSSSRNPKLIAIAKDRCRELRARQTRAEALLWEVVRGRRFERLKFYRQHPLFFDYLGKETFYVADLCCYERRLVVEIDGSIHITRRNEDALREEFIKTLGFKVVRFTNEEVENDLPGVLSHLRQEISELTTNRSLAKRGESEPGESARQSPSSLTKRRGPGGMSSKTLGV